MHIHIHIIYTYIYTYIYIHIYIIYTHTHICFIFTPPLLSAQMEAAARVGPWTVCQLFVGNAAAAGARTRMHFDQCVLILRVE